MDAEIIAVGTELLMGELVDSNSAFLASEFPKLGISLKMAVKIGDDLGDLVTGLDSALKRSDIVITTGGLGPTSDDLTRESIAQYFNEDMEVDTQLLKNLEDNFSRRGTKMPKTNIKQATLIPSATSLPNPNGTAPGWFVSKDSKIVIAMPGPPLELNAMWENHVAPKLASLSDGVAISTRTLKTFGRSEGELDELLSDLFGQENPYLGIYSKQDGIHLRAIAKSQISSEADSLINKIEAQITEKVGDSFIWGRDGETPPEVATNLLDENNLTLCVTESYTGGTLCSLLSECALYEKVFLKGTIASPSSMPAADYVESQPTCNEPCQADVHLKVSPLLVKENDGGTSFGDVNIKIESQNNATQLSSRYRMRNIRMRQRASNHALIELIKFIKSNY